MPEIHSIRLQTHPGSKSEFLCANGRDSHHVQHGVEIVTCYDLDIWSDLSENVGEHNLHQRVPAMITAICS